ncbi:hypothetical protein FZEAL_5398 [Fusarium zealandicum]|uniref:Uncharacterized protein n=1 Tax=Fusarium zealandicum TaxID=1053134 RepID=A0A8H4XKI3_9HYPO|nr:hypothetical protein FZEAL_5398 [Fusarium zealandicum]
MPGPPTPVSGCPLRRLEILDGVSTRTYSSCLPNRIFRLTIEGERPIDAETGTLVLLVHQGTQQVVSIRLGDLAKGSQSPNKIASIDTGLNRLCINTRGQIHAIIAQFEEKRDFIVAVCLLQKSGLHISDSIPHPPVSTQPQASDNGFNVGPRLSSITPISLPLPNYAHSLGAQSESSFTSMPNTPLRCSPNAPFQYMPSSQVCHPQRTSSLPIYSPPSFLHEPTPTGSQLNPYNMFLGRGSNMHIPRVGSPLKHSFNSDNSPIQSSYSTRSVPSSPSMFSAANSQAHSYIATAGSELPQSKRDYMINIESSKQGAASVNWEHALGPKGYGGQGLVHTEPEDFRDSMPQPRTLPFKTHTKRPASQQEPPHCNAVRKNISSPARPIRARSLASEKSQPMAASSKVKSTTLAAFATATRNAGCQTDVAIEASALHNHTRISRTVQTSRPSVSSTDPMVIVTDPGTLRKLDRATAKLFEQYGADVASGCDQKISAQFYMDQVFAKRRDFWLTKLGEISPGHWPAAV